MCKLIGNDLARLSPENYHTTKEEVITLTDTLYVSNSLARNETDQKRAADFGRCFDRFARDYNPDLVAGADDNCYRQKDINRYKQIMIQEGIEKLLERENTDKIGGKFKQRQLTVDDCAIWACMNGKNYVNDTSMPVAAGLGILRYECLHGATTSHIAAISRILVKLNLIEMTRNYHAGGDGITGRGRTYEPIGRSLEVPFLRPLKELKMQQLRERIEQRSKYRCDDRDRDAHDDDRDMPTETTKPAFKPLIIHLGRGAAGAVSMTTHSSRTRIMRKQNSPAPTTTSVSPEGLAEIDRLGLRSAQIPEF
jgi:hypothetical protein